MPPAATARQNRTRCSRRPTDGRPGEYNFPRTAHVVLCCRVIGIANHLRYHVLRQPLESTQYTSGDYRDALADHAVAQSIGTVADAYDNAMAESFVDSFKAELIRDRVWRTHTQMELAVVQWVAWFNTRRLHSSLGYRTPDEIEENWRQSMARDQILSAKTATSQVANDSLELVYLTP